MEENLIFNVILLNPNFRKRLIFGRLHWWRCIGLLLQWVITQILGVDPESIGKTSSKWTWRRGGCDRSKDSWVRENKTLLFSSFISELLENKLLLEEPFLDCCVTEVTWFRHRTPREEPGGVWGLCWCCLLVWPRGFAAAKHKALGTTLIWFELVRSVNSCTFSQKSKGLAWNGRMEHFLPLSSITRFQKIKKHRPNPKKSVFLFFLILPLCGQVSK